MESKDLSEKNAREAMMTVLPVHPRISEDGEKHQIKISKADEAAAFVAGFGRPVTEEESARVRRKIDWNLLPLMMVMYFVQFTDKSTLNAANIMGLKEDTHINQSQYNWLATIFYLAYLVFEWPQNLAMQKFPPGKWMSVNILAWGVTLCCMAVCKNFTGLMICRFILGACEGCITAGYLIVTSMFYTHSEGSRRVGYWFLMNGTAIIFNGLSAFGVYHVNHEIISPWKVYMLLTGGITLVLGVCFWFFIPNSPMTARFLTHEERVIAIERLKGESTGVENKEWKRDQFIEALKDWKSWAFAIFACINNFSNSLVQMKALIIKQFGFSVQQTNLLGCVDGVVEIVAIYSAVLILKRYPNARGIIGPSYFFFSITAGILLLSIPFHLSGVLLFATWLTTMGVPAFVLALSWCASSSTGHTKKTTVNAMLLIGYCVGNLASPQIWQSKYAPRYYIPWGIILATYVMCPIVLVGIRYFLKKENDRRDRIMADPSFVPERFFDEDGQEVDATFMDITDRKNLAFRYPL